MAAAVAGAEFKEGILEDQGEQDDTCHRKSGLGPRPCRLNEVGHANGGSRPEQPGTEAPEKSAEPGCGPRFHGSCSFDVCAHHQWEFNGE